MTAATCTTKWWRLGANVCATDACLVLCIDCFTTFSNTMKHTFHTLSLLSAMLLGAGSLSPSTALAQSSSLATPLGCATTGGWVYVAGTCDPQLRLQGRGTALWQKRLELKVSQGFTGNFVNGLPQGQGRLEGLEKYTRYSPTKARLFRAKFSCLPLASLGATRTNSRLRSVPTTYSV